MLNDILTLEDRAARYVDYMKRVKALRFLTGMDLIDEVIRGVAPGEVLIIIAYSGTFKTAYLQNLLGSAGERTGMMQMLFSMEMSAEKVFEREMQISNEMMGRAVEHHFSNETGKSAKMLAVARAKGCGNVLTVEKSRLALPTIKQYVKLAEEKYGEIQAIGIDYLGLMACAGKDLFTKMAELSYGLKETAKEIRKPIIVLAQVNRGYAQSKNVEIEMDAAKGGGDIEAAADFMFGMYKDTEEELILKILKNRNGVAGTQFKMTLDRAALKFLGAEAYTPKTAKKQSAPF